LCTSARRVGEKMTQMHELPPQNEEARRDRIIREDQPLFFGGAGVEDAYWTLLPPHQMTSDGDYLEE
jgi:hypothetical protein